MTKDYTEQIKGSSRQYTSVWLSVDEMGQQVDIELQLDRWERRNDM